jgi:Secretion system C-terminal sorting domain
VVNGQIFFRRSSIDAPVIPTFASMTWNGSLSTDWNVPDNWTPFGVPTAITNITIPSSLANYPKMTGDSTVNGINMIPGSSLDFNGKKLTVNTVAGHYNDISGATLSNSAAATDIVFDINTGTGGYTTTFNSNTVNDNITINLSGPNSFSEGTVGTKNTYNGNTTYNIDGATPFVFSQNIKSENNGDLIINRTASGNTTVFNAGGDITGNLAFSNLTSGTSVIGNNTNRTTINGKVDININNTATSGFGLYRLINQTTGGVISVQNTIGFEILNDTIKVNSLSLTGYKTGGYGRFVQNKITGDLTIADDASYSGGFDTRISHNEIIGTANFTNNGTNTFFEANETNSQNSFTGNVVYTASNSGVLNIGNQEKSTYGGNVTLARTAPGTTIIFQKGANITGNFSYVNPTSGTSSLGNTSQKTAIGGTVNIDISNTTTSGFGLYRFVNQTAGGTISAQNTIGFEAYNDTLLVNSLSIIGYRGGGYARFGENKISGNVTIADHSSYSGGFDTRISHNQIGGVSNFTNNGTNVFYEANESNSQNTFSGNVTYIANNTGELNIGNLAKTSYGGNVNISRTFAGTTTIFGKGADIAANFSYTNPASGSSSLGNSTQKTAIGGMVNVNISNTATSPFGLYRFVNQTDGGSVSVVNSQAFEVINDTLKVNSFSITDYQGNGYARFLENKITGNLNLSNNASFGGGFDTGIWHNEIGGDTQITNAGSNQLNDATNSNSGNKYLGNVTYNKTGGNITIATNSENEYGKGITFNSDAGINISKIKLNTASNGIIEQLGTQPLIIPNIVLDKPNGGKITLNDPLKIGNSIAFNQGKIISVLGNELIFPDDISYTGYSDASFVEGPVKKIGNEAFVFPVGGANKQAPVSISAPASATDEFRAQYVRAAPTNPTLKEASIDHLSLSEYWLLDRPVGVSDVFVTISWDGPRSGLVTNMADLRIAHFTGGQWKNEGNGSTTGTNVAGTIMSQLAVGSFSPFTLASATAIGNPLPLNLLSFSGKNTEFGNKLSWATAHEIALSHFEIEKGPLSLERGIANLKFEKIGEVKASGGPLENNSYQFTDTQTALGFGGLYRLKMVDLDGKFKYSKIINIENYGQTLPLGAGGLYPNPTSDYFSISGNEPFEKLQIVDISGRLVKEFLHQNDNKYGLNGLVGGVYLVKLVGGNELINSKLIIK